MNLLIAWVLNAVALMITAYVLPGFKVKGFGAAMFAAALIGLLNISVGVLLNVLALPITILTLGLFTFVISAIVLKIAAGLMDDFEIDGWGTAIVGAVVLAIVNWLFAVMF